MIEAMPRVPLPHLHREITRHGKAAWYVRRGHGPRLRIDGDYGSAAFLSAYAAAVAALTPARQPSDGRKVTAGTLAWLIERWRESSDWSRLAPATRRQREAILAHVVEAAGDEPLSRITPAVVRAGRERRKATPFAADNFLKTLKGLFRWAKEAGLAAADPAADVHLIKARTEGFPAWTLDDVERFRARWPLGTRERLAMELLLWTGLRRGDAVRLGRQHVRDGVATMRAEKTGEELFVPMLPPLARAIAAGPIGDLAFIARADGRPMTKESFGNWMRGACTAAGVRASAHGLRKLAATLLAEGGGSETELQALFGWRDPKQSAVYTRSASRRRLAESAARKLMGNADFPHPRSPVPAPGKKKGNIKGL